MNHKNNFNGCLLEFVFTFLLLSLVFYTRYHGPFARYAKLRVAHAPGMPATFSPTLPVRDPDMHHGTCVTHVPWCMSGSLTSGFLWSRWRGKRSRYPGACATRTFTYLVRGPCYTGPRYEESSILWSTVWLAYPKHDHIIQTFDSLNRIFRHLLSSKMISKYLR